VSGLFASGRVVDLILLVIAAEAAWLLRRPRRRGGRSVGEAAFALLPGVCLLLALRFALTGEHWSWIAGALAASFPLHLLDLQRRRDGRR